MELCHGDTLETALMCFLTFTKNRIGYDVGVHGFLYTDSIVLDTELKFETEISGDIVRKLDGISSMKKVDLCLLTEDLENWKSLNICIM